MDDLDSGNRSACFAYNPRIKSKGMLRERYGLRYSSWGRKECVDRRLIEEEAMNAINQVACWMPREHNPI